MTKTIHINKPEIKKQTGWRAGDIAFKGFSDSARIMTNCCHCRMSLKKVKVKTMFFDWYPPHDEIKCMTDSGCNKNPRKKVGIHLRPFVVEYIIKDGNNYYGRA